MTPEERMRMLGVSIGTIRLFLHVLGATVWVGGQLTLAALVPVLRRVAPEATAAAARGFNRIAWPAYVLLLGTGAWNIVAVGSQSAAYRRTLAVKIAVVVLSGVAAFAHARSRSRWALAVFGALTGLAALGALFLGVLLAG